jgi:hypothetical protein
MTDNDIIHVGDVGTVITLTIYEDDGTTVVDVSSATTKTIYFKSPSGTKKNATASFTTDGKDGKIYYTTVAGFIDTAGVWEVQGYVEIGTAKYYSTKGRFQVHGNLA